MTIEATPEEVPKQPTEEGERRYRISFTSMRVMHYDGATPFHLHGGPQISS